MKFKVLLLLAFSAFLIPTISAQDAPSSKQTVQGEAAAPPLAPGSVNGGQSCPRIPDRDWPVHQTIVARVSGLMDSAHLKPGKEVFAKVMYPIAYADCALDEEAILYGHVTAAVWSKSPNLSELGLTFDHADCRGHQKQEVRLRMIGLIAPPDRGTMLHDVLPSEVAGGVQQLPVTSQDGIDDSLHSEKFPPSIHPGLVVRMPKVSLEPEGAPDCSAKISGDGRPVQVVPGTALILTMERMTKSKQ